MYICVCVCVQIFVQLTEKEQTSSEKSNQSNTSVPQRCSVDSRILHASHKSCDSRTPQDGAIRGARVGLEEGGEGVELKEMGSVFDEEGVDGKSRISSDLVLGPRLCISCVHKARIIKNVADVDWTHT